MFRGVRAFRVRAQIKRAEVLEAAKTKHGIEKVPPGAYGKVMKELGRSQSSIWFAKVCVLDAEGMEGELH